MTTKVIYFTTDSVEIEKAEFSTCDDTEAVRDLFRSAAEAAPYDIIKLYNSDGNLVNISQHLDDNLPSNPYKLVIVASNRKQLASVSGFDVMSLERRLESLERQVLVENGGIPDNLMQMSRQLEALRSKVENIEHLSWIGLSKEIKGRKTQYLNSNNNWKKQVPVNYKHDDTCSKVFEQFERMSYMEVKPEVKELLRSVDFNNWQWDEPEMLVLLKQMYEELGLIQHFTIPRETFINWLCEVFKNYNRVPFHNFKHCFMVTQMMFGLINLLNLVELMSMEEIFILITSAICHDLDHPGYNNNYQVNAQTELALRYNDASPLENHHCYVAFRILTKDECNILKNVSVQTYKNIRQGMIRCILATDMARHNEILQCYKSMHGSFDWQDTTHRNQLMMILIKCADISNECRPMEVAEPWIDCLLQEFFNQSDLEKEEGLPVSPFMDREKVNKNSSQVNFIRFVLLPLFESLASQFPQVQGPIIVPLQDALTYYHKLSTCPVQSSSGLDNLPTSRQSLVTSTTSNTTANTSTHSTNTVSTTATASVTSTTTTRITTNNNELPESSDFNRTKTQLLTSSSTSHSTQRSADKVNGSSQCNSSIPKCQMKSKSNNKLLSQSVTQNGTL